MKSPRRAPLPSIAACLAAAIAAGDDARAVSLNADGLGQALIFPYYTAQAASGNAFNTYISIVNHRSEAKALRVRFREGRAAREVLGFNLFLSPNDVWTGAVVPNGAGARLVSSDVSCTDPPLGADLPQEFRNTSYAGMQSDGFGDGLDRTREGFVEVLEMATLTGTSADAVTHLASGAPANCAQVRGAAALDVARPNGGISGSLTLINVSSGLDFTVNADALADLASRPYYRPPGNPYPDFAAGEIDPVSTVVADGQMYRSVWSNPVNAVSASLMRSAWLTEYVLDPGTASLTDVVLTFPTRHLHAAVTVSPPFSAPARWAAGCERTAGLPTDERIGITVYNREERSTIFAPCDFATCPPPPPLPGICAAAAVGTIANGAAHIPAGPESPVLGSLTRGLALGGGFFVPATFSNGWIRLAASNALPMVSLPTSTRVDLATGQQTTGPHQYGGLPVLGLTVRTFRNGTLNCTGGTCQGNYGGAFPLKYLRTITPPG